MTVLTAIKSCLRSLLPAVILTLAVTAVAAGQNEYRLGPGDSIHIQVFQNPDLTLDTRVSENGAITFPLIGSVSVGGLALSAAEQQIARQLAEGGYVVKPQVSVVLTQNRSSQVSVLGEVNHPGRFPLETVNNRLSELIAAAGGIAPTGSDRVVLSGTRDGKPFWKEIEINGLFRQDRQQEDIAVAGGDVIFVPKAPVFYIYGEVQRPGSYRLERNMTVRQALVQGGGLTPRGTERRMHLERHNPDGSVADLRPEPGDMVQAEDVIRVSESIF